MPRPLLPAGPPPLKIIRRPASPRPLAAPRAVELVIIRTEGDRVPDVSLAVIGGQGVFTKEIQRALLADQIDVAVHSLKDLPTDPVAGLTLGAVPTRGPSGDVLVSRDNRHFDDLASGTRIATGSLRRRSLLQHRRPGVQFIDLRGNVDTRLHLLDRGDFNAIVLAHAGLERLGLSDRITEVLDPTWMIPAVGQGALGLECRVDDADIRTLLAPLDDSPTHAEVLAERSLLFHLGGGCQVPIGAIGVVTHDRLLLRAVVLKPDGSARIDGEITGSVAECDNLGRQLAQELDERGARQMIRDVSAKTGL
jgi:hydroxymethylbilane synthase